MGTRSLTVFKDGAKEIAVMYRQFDGYITGHGLELAEFLKPMRLVNGFGSTDRAGTVANGMGCLAAQIIAHFKGKQEEPGGFYLHPAGTRQCDDEFIYYVNAGFCEIRRKQVPFVIAQMSNGQTLYEGPAADMVASIRLAQAAEQRFLTFRRQIARTLFLNAYASWKEEYDGGFPAGTEIDKVAPTTPPYCVEKADKLIKEVEKVNGRTLEELYQKALEESGMYGCDTIYVCELWAHYLTMECLGSGVAWADDHHEYDHKIPLIEYSAFDLDDKNFPIPEDFGGLISHDNDDEEDAH